MITLVEGALSQRQSLTAEVSALGEEEQRLEKLIQRCSLDIKQMTTYCYSVCFFFLNPAVCTYAYITYQDIKQLGSLRDQTVIVVKAPTDTKLEVPDPDESLSIHLSSTKGPIEVLLCPDEENDMRSPVKNDSNCTTTSPSTFLSPPASSSAVSVTTLSPISSPYTSLLQQTEDQVPSSQGPFLNLVPPILEDDYLLGLEDDQGISDLFDACDFDKMPSLGLDDLLCS
uniref:E2F transcription factor CC-MB domain-containing protein n=1 Tax=Poecilia reticulata TaxID=8081 RepID=A0A3P9P2N9_POERE